MEPSLVSVVIPTKNRALYLKQAIDSVYAQSYQDFEVVIIDDGSTDGTRDVTAAYDSRLHYFFQAQKGVSAARNNGIKKARGEYIAFLDDDDLFAPEKLHLSIERLEKDPETIWVCSGFSFIDAKGQPLPRPDIIPSKPDVTLHDIAMFRFIHTSSVVVRRKNLHMTGGFPENVVVSEDYHAWAKLLQTGKGAALQKSLTYFRRHDGNTKLPYRTLLQENTRIIDAILASGAPGIMPREIYMQNLYRIISESLWYEKKWSEAIPFYFFRLFTHSQNRQRNT